MSGIGNELVLRWLHLTDLHVGSDNESQRTALTSLLESVEQNAGGRPFDLIVLSGDLAYSGLKVQYDELERQIIAPLRRNPLFSKALIVAAPGNHDMDCDIGVPVVWSEIGKSRQERFFHLGEDGKRVRASRAASMTEYSVFVKRCGIRSAIPIDEPASLCRFNIGGKSFVLVSLVTCFFSDREVSDERRSYAPVHPLRTLLQGVSTEEQVIVVGHHPLEWFTTESENQLYSLLVEKNAIYLHGHEHLPRPRFGIRGLAALGFGAAYPGSGIGSTSAYRNSYAICELTDELHVGISSWDAQYGQWRPEQQIPADFRDRSTRLPDGYTLWLSRTRLGDRRRPYSALESAIREEVDLERCLWLSEDSVKTWARLLRTLGIVRDQGQTFALPTQRMPPGHVEFRLHARNQKFLVYAVSAQGDILHQEQLQSINTELDRQDYDGCYVLTLGEMSEDAKTLATQLSSRKNLILLTRSEVLRRILRHLPSKLTRALLTAAEDGRDLAGTLVIRDEGFGLILQERLSSQWFQVLDGDGAVVPEVDSFILKIRNEQPVLKSLRYLEGTSVPLMTSSVEPIESRKFDKEQYLQLSHAHFDAVKYAPLAAIGMRFRKASLSEIYVQASADVGGASKAAHGLNRAVSEFVESLSLPKAQQDLLEAQLRSKYGLNRSAEVGAARTLYQRYNNIVVLGDPGSGKTCFVQYEILAYCNPPEDWYARHLPVYVSLAEAARLYSDQATLLDICQTVAARRGVYLPKPVLESLLAEGHIAFFFDGLDEVGFIDRRIALLSEIGALMDLYAARGNRFVLASRPAAVQPVDIPEGMTYLQLKGLTEEEIRTLASRVLTTRVGEGESKVLTEDEKELVQRLLEDTREQPGIARIARNPLLLTLLVLVYANSGALSARRHLVYTQAVKTLVSVRGRQTREQQISESDLRTRLGAIALAIFQRSIAEIPRRRDVVKLLSPHLKRLGGSDDCGLADVVSDFMQEVSEATGLLVIHPHESDKSQDLITFMHYSFLEYYASAGLLSKNFLDVVPIVASNPRWRDVITLLFGMLSETSDVTPLLRRLLDANDDSETVTQVRFLLALDCACECDVPPEDSQDCIAAAIYEVMGSGAGKYSEDLRREIAERIDDLLQIASLRTERVLIQGLRDSRPEVAAAFADLIGHINQEVRLSMAVVDAFERCLEVSDPVARSAAMSAIERRAEFRTEKAKACVEVTLKGTVVEKLAALKVVAVVPAFLDDLRMKVLDLLDDKNPLIAAAAAQCTLVWALHHADSAATLPMQKVLAKLQLSTEDAGLSIRGVTLDKPIVTSLVHSPDGIESERAIRNLALMREDGKFVYELLVSKMRQEPGPRVLAACLDGIRDCPGAADLITLADTDYICSLLQRPHRNIRIAAICLLGELPDDEQVVQSLQLHFEDLVRTATEDKELAETARALAKHVRRNSRLQEKTLAKLIARLPVDQDPSFGDKSEQEHTLALLSVCDAIGGVDDKAAWRVLSLASNFRVPEALRKSAYRLFGRLVLPTEASARAVTTLLNQDDLRWNDAKYVAANSFIQQARRKVDYVRAIYPVLGELRAALCSAWKREAKRTTMSISPSGMRELRDGVIELDRLIVSYGEFSGRVVADVAT